MTVNAGTSKAADTGRRISEHRTKEAEGEIRRVYQNLLKDLRAFVAGEYEAVCRG